jgi:hypothetical protein
MGSAILAASSLSALAEANEVGDNHDDEVLYGHGQVWNRALVVVAIIGVLIALLLPAVQS